jgi:hypothetical protein
MKDVNADDIENGVTITIIRDGNVLIAYKNFVEINRMDMGGEFVGDYKIPELFLGCASPQSYEKKHRYHCEVDNEFISILKNESDIENIVRRIVLEQEQEQIKLQSKDIKPVFTPQKFASIKSQADVLAKDTELIKSVLDTLKRFDPEAYYMLTRGNDPVKRTALGDLITVGSVIGMIYGIVQELRGR